MVTMHYICLWCETSFNHTVHVNTFSPCCLYSTLMHYFSLGHIVLHQAYESRISITVAQCLRAQMQRVVP